MGTRIFVLCAMMLGSCAGSRVGGSPPGDDRAVAPELRAYRRFALEPAQVAPPTVSWAGDVVEVGPLRARARPLRPEDAEWNHWVDGSARLFNNRMAHLFQVRIEGPGPLRWLPWESRLEVNGVEIRLSPAPDPDTLLRELTLWALTEERAGIEGDLAERARAAGPFRAAYLPLRTQGDLLEGLVAFDLLEGWEESGGVPLGELHVVALRLTLGVRAEGADHRLVWVFD